MHLRVLTVALLVVAVTASPASAKEGFRSTLSGPGLVAGGIELPPTPILRAAQSRPGRVPHIQVDTGSARIVRGGLPDDLGPRYVIAFPWRISNARQGRFVQHLYPFASGGPVVHIPGGQSFYRYRDQKAAKTFRVDGGPEAAFRWLGYKDPKVAADLVPMRPKAAGEPSSVAAHDPTDYGRVLGWTGLMAVALGSVVLVASRRPGHLARG